MTKPVLVDTDVMIDYLRGYPKAVTFVKTRSDRIILSSIVVAELYAGVKGEAELATLDDFIFLFHIVPVSKALAREGGLYKRDYARSHGIGMADALIAATAVAEDAQLKTLNIKHYPMFKTLKPAYRKT